MRRRRPNDPFWDDEDEDELTTQDYIEKAIRKAMERGEFDNLPGMGKPFRFEYDRHVPIEQRLAYRIMRDNDVLPDWIQLQQELDVLLKKARNNLRRNYQLAQKMRDKADQHHDPIVAVRMRLEAGDQIEHGLATFRDRVRVINSKISVYNLKVPASHLTRDLLDAQQEIEAIQSENQTD